jgi:hypothetical protein
MRLSPSNYSIVTKTVKSIYMYFLYSWMVCTCQKTTFERKEKSFRGWVSLKLTGTVDCNMIKKVSNKLKINKLVKAEITRQEFVHWEKK